MYSREDDPLTLVMSHTRLERSITGIAGETFAALASTMSARAAGWDAVPSSSDSVTVESWGPSALLARLDGAWVLYSPTLSTSCAPPRGCYANKQRIHYDFSCSPRYAVMTERISIDINGNVVKHEVTAPAGSYAPASDAGAIQVLATFCPLPDRD